MVYVCVCVCVNNITMSSCITLVWVSSSWAYICLDAFRMLETWDSLSLSLSLSTETRESWSRDDPAFLVCICAFLLVSTLGYTIFLRLGIIGFFITCLWTVLVDCIITGLIVSTLLWYVYEKFIWKYKHLFLLSLLSFSFTPHPLSPFSLTHSFPFYSPFLSLSLSLPLPLSLFLF